jgi:hypothetical protein
MLEYGISALAQSGHGWRCPLGAKADVTIAAKRLFMTQADKARACMIFFTQPAVEACYRSSY